MELPFDRACGGPFELTNDGPAARESSLDEAESQVLGGFDKGYFLPEKAAAVRTRIARARRTILGLKRYLTTSQAPA